MARNFNSVPHLIFELKRGNMSSVSFAICNRAPSRWHEPRTRDTGQVEAYLLPKKTAHNISQHPRLLKYDFYVESYRIQHKTKQLFKTDKPHTDGVTARNFWTLGRRARIQTGRNSKQRPAVPPIISFTHISIHKLSFSK